MLPTTEAANQTLRCVAGSTDGKPHKTERPRKPRQVPSYSPDSSWTHLADPCSDNRSTPESSSAPTSHVRVLSQHSTHLSATRKTNGNPRNRSLAQTRRTKRQSPRIVPRKSGPSDVPGSRDPRPIRKQAMSAYFSQKTATFVATCRRGFFELALQNPEDRGLLLSTEIFLFKGNDASHVSNRAIIQSTTPYEDDPSADMGCLVSRSNVARQSAGWR